MMINSSPNTSGWSLHAGYTDQSNKNSYPIRAFGSKKNSLNIVVGNGPNGDIFCGSQYSLFTVIIGVPGEMVPNIFMNFDRGD